MRKFFGFTLSPLPFALSRVGAMLLALCVSAQAQQPEKRLPRIGVLHTGSASDPVNSRRLDVFRQSLRDLGYIDGKNITIEYRYGEGKSERLQQLAEELVRSNVDILVASTATAARSIRKATTTIPIVVANMGSLTGLVDSLARPGGNVTGLTHISSELLGKRLELLTEVLPKVSRFVFLNDTTGAGGYERVAKETQGAAKALGVKLQVIEVKVPDPDIDGVFRTMVKERVGGFIIEATPRMSFHRKKILALAQQNRLPAIYSEEEWVNAGGLMSYGANRNEPYRRIAVYVDKILKGAKPAELPVEQPTKFDLVINLKSAKQIELTVPPNVLARADRVIR